MGLTEQARMMGQIVTVQRVFKRVTKNEFRGPVAAAGRRWTNRRREWEAKEIEPRAGWIVGFRTLHNGVYDPGWEDSQATLTVTNSVRAALVAYWPSMTAVKVPLDGFTMDDDLQPISPTEELFRRAPFHREEQAQTMRDETKNWPRNSQGRWKAFLDFTAEERARFPEVWAGLDE